MKSGVLKAVTDMIIDNDDIWMISDEWNGLLKYSIAKKKLELEISFPETIGTAYSAFSKIIKLEDEIYFIPAKAKGIFYYSFTEKKMFSLEIPVEDLPEVKNMGAVVKEKYIYCISRFPDTVIEIDTVTKKVKVFHADIDQYIDESIERKIYRTYKEPCLDKGKIFWTNYSGMLIMFDTENRSFSVNYLVGLSQEKSYRMQEAYGTELKDWIMGVRVFKGIMFLFSIEGRIYQCGEKVYEIKNDLFDKYVNCSDADDLISAIFYDLIALNNNLYFISYYKNKCVKYNNVSQEFEETLYSYRENWNGNRRSYTLCKIIDKQKMVLYSYYESCFYILDFEKDFVEKAYLLLPDVTIELAKKDLVFAKMLLDHMEAKDNLESLFVRAFCENDREERVLLTNRTVGRKIYEALI